MENKQYIKFYRYIRLTGTTASFLLFLFATLVCFPFAPKSSNLADAIGTPIESETTIAMNIDKASANLSVAPVKPTGTFTSSSEEDLASFDVITNNYTGYTLSITATDDDGKLTSSIIDEETGDITATSTLDSISNATDRATFAGEDNTVFNGRWGYKPSKYNSTDNIVFLPSPTTDADILDTTNKANNEANNYTIGLGARVDYTKLAGTYSDTFILTAVGNPVAYTLNYLDNSGDTDVTNMPDTDSSTSASTKVAVSSRIPSRGSKYTFAGWCDEMPTINADGSSTCSGTIYQPSTESTPSYVDFINQTTELSTITLYTTWNINSYLQTVEVRYQNTDGSWTNYETYDTCTKTVAYGETHSCSIDATTEYQAASLASYIVTGAATKQIDVYRNTRTVSLTKGTGVSSVSVTGSGVKSGSGTASATVYYGGAVTISASMSSGYDWVNWTGSATYSNQSQSISSVTSNLSFTANGKSSCQSFGITTMQNFDPNKLCSGQGTSGTLTDSRDNQNYTVAEINDQWWMTKNLNLAGGTKLYSDTSNVPDGYPSSGNNPYYTLPISYSSGFSDDSTAYVYKSSSTTCSSTSPCYSYYSYVAATAGTNPSSSNASSDICPKGWRLPTDTEYTTLVNTFTTGARLTGSPFRGVLAGYYNDSSFEGGGYGGYYWSSTARSSSYAYFLNFDSDANVYNVRKRVGHSVRCVLQ